MKFYLTHQDGKSEVVELTPTATRRESGGVAPGAQFVLAVGAVIICFWAWRDWVNEKKQKKGSV